MSTHDLESKMLQSISEELGIPNLLDVLSTVPMRRLQPILVHAFKNRAGARKPSDLLREYEAKQEFFGTSIIPQDELHDFARVCHKAVVADFEVVQTSPIVPLGLNAVLSKVSQNNILSSIRGSEVVSDITSQLALECAFRRKRMSAGVDQAGVQGVVNLCTSGRVLRLQPFDKTKGYMQHFNLFALCSGGMNAPADGGFAVPMLMKHISSLLDVLYALWTTGYGCEDIVVSISDMRFLDQLIDAQNMPREEILRNSLNDEFDLFREYNVRFPREVDNVAGLDSQMFTGLGLAWMIARSTLVVSNRKLWSRSERNIRACDSVSISRGSQDLATIPIFVFTYLRRTARTM